MKTYLGIVLLASALALISLGVLTYFVWGLVYEIRKDSYYTPENKQRTPVIEDADRCWLYTERWDGYISAGKINESCDYWINDYEHNKTSR